MDIRNNIAELLSLHNCVIIPGFGGFIGNYAPARIDPVNHTFQPPAKVLLFNINLKQNDGLLANDVASTHGVSYPEACRLIDEFSEACRITLKTGQPYVLPRVGNLFPGTEGIIHFEQDSTANLLADSFGLTPFISPPVIRNSSAIHIDWTHSSQVPGPTGKRYVFPRALKWAAMLALPVGIAAVIGVTQYDKISSNLSNHAGILSSVFTRFYSASLVEKKEAPVLPRKTIVMPARPAPPVEKPAAVNPGGRFAVIVGAFKVQENAEKLIAELQQKGISASIFDQSKTGLFRVTIGTSATRDDARHLLASAKTAAINGAWILAK